MVNGILLVIKKRGTELGWLAEMWVDLEIIIQNEVRKRKTSTIY